jgi:hypothetical protein
MTFELSFDSHLVEEISKSKAAKAMCPKNKKRTLKVVFILKIKKISLRQVKFELFESISKST